MFSPAARVCARKLRTERAPLSVVQDQVRRVRKGLSISLNKTTPQTSDDKKMFLNDIAHE